MMAQTLGGLAGRPAVAPQLCGRVSGARRVSLRAARPLGLSVRAEAKDPNDAGKFSFGGGGSSEKQDAAKKALQDALSGTFGGKDILEAYDAAPPSGGGGSGGGGGGGGWGGFGDGFDFNEFGDNLRKSFGGFFTAILTFLSFGGIIFAISFFKPMCRLVVSLLRKVLMLDGPGQTPAPVAAGGAPLIDDGGEELSAAEASVVSKFAEAEDDFFGAEDEEEQ